MSECPICKKVGVLIVISKFNIDLTACLDCAHYMIGKWRRGD